MLIYKKAVFCLESSLFYEYLQSMFITHFSSRIVILRNILVFIITVCVYTYCVKKGPEPVEDNLIPFDKAHKIIAEKIISCFENSTPIIQYDYIEYLNDGRGYTAGKAGFTTATGDMLQLIELYTDSVPTNNLAYFIPTIKEYSQHENNSIKGLENLPKAWKQACKDSVFIHCQDIIADSLYYIPAVRIAKQLGLRYPLSLLNIYDAIIQHGEGDDPDGLPAIIHKTNTKCGGYPLQGIHEYIWLETFIDIRKSIVKHAHNADTRKEWRESVDRVTALDKLRKEGNFLLQGTIEIKVYGDTFKITYK